MRQINWGIIGCGNVTELKSGPAFNKVPGSNLLAVMRRDSEKASDYARRHHVPVWTTNADEIISNPDINAVYVATPPGSHSEYAIRALKAGKPVYVEKPMAANYEDCLKMKEAADAGGLPLFVAYYRRYLPYFIKIREMLSCQLIGRILYATIDFHIAPRKEDFNPGSLPWRVKAEIAGAGYFYDLACHQLDLMEWYFGVPRHVTGSSYNRRGLYQAEDMVFGHILYESGVPLEARWCFASGNNEHKDVITIHGDKGSMEFSTFDFTPIKLVTEGCMDEFLPENPENIQYWFIKNMVEELQSSENTRGNAESALRTNWVMDKMLGKI